MRKFESSRKLSFNIGIFPALAIALLLILLGGRAFAHAPLAPPKVPLDIVDVAAPDINCIFDLDCTITVTDTTDHFVLGGAGDAFLQSRTLPPGEPGTVGEGLFAYEYRIDLTDLMGITHIPCVTSFSIDFGSVVPLDYDGDGSSEEVYVVTAGGIGTVAPVSADTSGSTIVFSFGPAVCAGGSPESGDSSFFFGLASLSPPRDVTAHIQDNLGVVDELNARAPALTPLITLSPEAGPAGTSVIISGSGYVPGGYDGTIRWDGVDMDIFFIPQGGAFTVAFNIPSDILPGVHTITVCSGSPCFGGEFEQSASAAFEVTGEEPPRPSEQDFFFGPRGEKVPVTVFLERIGIIVEEGVDAGRIKIFAGQLGLEFLDQVSDSMFILGLQGPLPRLEVVKLARTVKTVGQQEGLLKEAGLVVTIEGDPSPIIVTDEFIALFNPQITRSEIDNFNNSNDVQIVSPDLYVENQFLLTVTDRSSLDPLTMANRYHESELTDFSHPNFWVVYEILDTVPDDPMFGNQWHHRNTGQNGGTVDADADTSLAWDISMGTPAVVIAIQDAGIDIDHEDLAPNLFTNAGETPGDGIDNDSNGFVDDVNGWDFISNDNDPRPVGTGEAHGTSVAGVAAARGNNTLGVIGGCPNCRILPIRLCCTNNVNSFANAFNYSAAMGAHVINNSWGHTSPVGVVPTVVANAINNSAAAGSIIFFAGGNGNTSGWCGASYPSLNNSVIAVSSSSNQDRKVVQAATGNCIDVLAPSHRGYSATDPYTGTLNITTTDRTGTPGYNNAIPLEPTVIDDCPLAEPVDTNYTHCFGGTSSASPLAAGIAGLVRSVNATMTRLQVQRLLQDTVDKVEPGVADYDDNNGFSNPPSGVATHSWGRINAFEAARIAAPVAQGGKDGVDVFLRDNRLDWGNTEQPSNVLMEATRGFIGHWRSEDIKVDAPPYQPAPTATTFDAFFDESPSAISGDVNRVYVRVRNRGPVTASSVAVKLHWAQFGTALPALPPDFWTAFPADSSDTSQLHPLECGGSASTVCTINDLEYSGSSIAGTAADAAQIVQFDFPAPPVDPMKPNHFCLLAMIDGSQDPISNSSKATFVIDSITPNDNNVTHRNYEANLDTTLDTRFVRRFFVRNPFEEPISTRLKLIAPEALRQEWKIYLEGANFEDPFPLQPREEILFTVNVEIPQPGQSAEISIVQERVDTPVFPEVLGGLSFRFQKQVSQADPSFTLRQDSSDDATGFKVDLTRVFDPATGSNVNVDLESFQAELTHLDASANPGFPPGTLCVNILDVREMDFPITGRSINNTSGLTSFDGSDVSGLPWPTDLGHVLTRLNGSATQQCQVALEVTSLSDIDANPIAVPPILSQTVQRGDARADGEITIADALFIAEYLAGSREACTTEVTTSCLHLVNAASVHQDGDFDRVTIADALFIAQYLSGLRDDFYSVIPASPNSVTFDLNQENNSGQSGKATLTSRNDQTEVVLNLTPGELATELAHIHSGQCGDSLGGVVHPLTSFADGAGVSVTIVNAPLSSFLTGDFAVNTHKKGEPSVFTACGNIPAAP